MGVSVCRAGRSQEVRTGGFTLTELLVALVIVGILSAVAVPVYQQYLVKARRTAAQGQMMDLANREQQFLLVNRSYATRADLEAAGYTLSTELRRSYDWSVAVTTTPPGFVLSFTPVPGGPQANDDTLTLDQTGRGTPGARW